MRRWRAAATVFSLVCGPFPYNRPDYPETDALSRLRGCMSMLGHARALSSAGRLTPRGLPLAFAGQRSDERVSLPVATTSAAGREHALLKSLGASAAEGRFDGTRGRPLTS